MRAQPLCQACAFTGIFEVATDCDHWIPRAQGGPELEWGNLVNLCGGHHSRKTAAEQAGLPPPFQIVPIVAEPRLLVT
jgi:5-methylcytosine-specific restriction endonuclease McrA